MKIERIVFITLPEHLEARELNDTTQRLRSYQYQLNSMMILFRASENEARKERLANEYEYLLKARNYLIDVLKNEGFRLAIKSLKE